MLGKDLVHPVYLDLPMMISFLASIEGGVSYGASVRTTLGNRAHESSEASANIGAPIISSLFNLNIKGELTGKSSESSEEEIEIVKRHTQASLFNKLRATLHDQKCVKKINTLDELEELATSDLIEITGEIHRNPVFIVTSVFERMRSLIEQSQKGQSTKKSWRDTKDFLKLLKDDVDNSKGQDVIMEAKGTKDLKCVISLSTEYLRDPSMEELLAGEFSLLGKVTKCLKPDEELNLLRRTMFGCFPFKVVKEIFDSLSSDESLNITIPDLMVSYPAIQVIPLAIFV